MEREGLTGEKKWESRGEEGIQGKRTNTEYLLTKSYENYFITAEVQSLLL